MPRGIPSYKSGLGYGQEIDNQTPLKFSTFNIPSVIPITSKFLTSSYVKSDQQSIFTRTDTRNGKRKREDEDDSPENTPPPQGPRGSNVIVIHPGTRNMRVGLASSLSPVTIPSVVARKSEHAEEDRYTKGSPLSHEYERNRRIEKSKALKAEGLIDENVDVSNPFDSNVIMQDDPKRTNSVPSLRKMMRQRFESLKLRWNADANAIVFKYNSQVQPEPADENYESHKPNWTVPKPGEKYLVGQRALDLPDPAAAGYELHWPFYGTMFNLKEYDDLAILLNDIETLLEGAIGDALHIHPRSYKHYSIMLVIPDWYEWHYLKDLVDILLHDMGFDGVCIQQESACAAYGSGLGNACVVDLGAKKISIACVEDGMLMTETRMVLNYGGDDISIILNAMLERCHFPFVGLDPGLPWGWKILEDIKINHCTLVENALAVNTFDIIIRAPNQKAQRYKFRLYDEIVIPPMLLFEPRGLDWDESIWRTSKLYNPDVDDVGDAPPIGPTQAMIGSTSHLQTQAIAHERSEDERYRLHLEKHQAAVDAWNSSRPMQLDLHTPPTNGDRRLSTQFSPQQTPNPPTPGSGTGRFNSTPVPANNVVWRPPVLVGKGDVPPTTNGAGSAKSPSEERHPPGLNATIKMPSSASPPVEPHQPSPAAAGQVPNGVQVHTPGPPAPTLTPFVRTPAPLYDISFEASKIPLDIAIFNSTRAASHVEKSRKFLQSVLLVGGVAQTQSIIPQLEARLAGLVSRYLPGSDDRVKPQVITPKDMDPQIVVWKGAALFSKLESASDLWIKSTEWELLGTRAFKERTLFI
ncbi:actin-like ATPase domain-containing protein [Calocera viscosa TUFC12733]|uniref:Actin-like ATPase domain-containing protein n=1 Tax=Calocera viscosa (strain TUFC12733) TaxID=1330018 RepID=A0A167S624_CALVF|nr:actin-like ATPase domain-containing protein [Calocera viscosa TUFC12733]